MPFTKEDIIIIEVLRREKGKEQRHGNRISEQKLVFVVINRSLTWQSKNTKDAHCTNCRCSWGAGIQPGKCTGYSQNGSSDLARDWNFQNISASDHWAWLIIGMSEEEAHDLTAANRITRLERQEATEEVTSTQEFHSAGFRRKSIYCLSTDGSPEWSSLCAIRSPNGAYYRDVLLTQYLLPAIKWVSSFWGILHIPAGQCPAHPARDTLGLLSEETPDFIPPQLWPPNSPDLSPVDYQI